METITYDCVARTNRKLDRSFTFAHDASDDDMTRAIREHALTVYPIVHIETMTDQIDVYARFTETKPFRKVATYMP